MEINLCPRWLAATLGLPAGKHLHFELLCSSILALAALPVLIHIPHICLARTLFGIPCLGCGVLHAMIAVAQLRFGEAWRSNPAGIAFAVFLGFQILARPVALVREETGDRVSAVSRWGSNAVIACLLGQWTLRVL